MSSSDYERMARSIRWLRAHAPERPSLERAAAAAGLSPHHFQRAFKRWAGVSPKRYLQHLAAEGAREALARSGSVLEASYAAGLSGPGRLHDLVVNVEALTPGELARRGEGVTLRVGTAETPFGPAVIARSERGLSGLAFVDGDEDAARAHVLRHWTRARVVEDAASAREVAARLASAERRAKGRPLTLVLAGTNFQVQVWRALLAIPAGATASYSDVAREIGAPRAVRAVGTAVGANALAWIVPCHRVLREDGTLGGYRWGLERKSALLAWEAARHA